MADPSQANSALDPRALAEAAVARLPVDLGSLPPEVLTRLHERARAPDRRLMVSRYVILGELGRGGMGVVYEAWDPGIERKVAIKTVEPDLVAEEDREEVIERFKRETKIVGRLHHPGIVTIFDSGMDRDQTGLGTKIYYYVMEHLDGQSLARILRERRTMPDIEAVTIVADVLEALHVSHSAGVIHRDIKPSNIFLRSGGQAVLLDFGIAKTGSVALTRQGQILGTPSYLAPERLREKEVAVDGRADIFSLGVLLFTMLTGEAPFVGEDVYDVIDKIAKASHPKLARTTPSGQALSRVIDKMLAKRPEDRYGSAAEAAKALRGVLGLLRATNPEISDLLAGVRVKDEMPESATEIATPSSALALPDEVDTGRHGLDRGRGRASVEDTRQDPPPENAEATKVTDRAVERAADPISDTPVRMVDLLGTRPELALIRETREIDRDPRPLAPLPPVRTIESLVDAGSDVPPTMPGRPAYTGGEADSGEYESHAPSNDETTDDQTVAEPDAPKRPLPSLRPSSGGLRGREPPPIPGSTRPVGASKAAAALQSPIPLAQTTKSPPGGAPVVSAPKSPSGPSPLPPKGASGPVPVAPIAAQARPRGDERPTEQLRAASGDERTESAFEAGPRAAPASAEERGRPSIRPAGPKPQRSRRSRIEASLVDEDDVVVKPAPLDALKPDEMPTQTGFRVPPAGSIAPSPSVQDAEIRVRGDGRVPDPAEPPSETTEGGALLADAETREEPRGGVLGEVELEDASGPIPELDAPRSAAVARRTFGARGAGPAAPPARGAKAGGGAGVQVRVTGSLGVDRLRVVRRRGFMLVIAMLAAIAVGLFLGRLKQRSAALDAPGSPRPIVIEPRVTRANLPTPGGEPELVKPRPASELIQEASVALSELNVPKAEELFERASRAAPERSRLRGQAMLGRADALQKLGKKELSIELYRAVMSDLPRTPEAEEARVALSELGAEPPAASPAEGAAREARAARVSPPAPAKAREEPPAPAQRVPSLPTEPTPEMSPEQKCLAVMAKHLNDPGQAVVALNQLAREDPRSPCVHWHLGNSYSKLRDDRAALAAYRKYLDLRPDALNRAAVEERIKNLATKLEER